MQFWQPILDRTRGPLYLSLADAITQAVAAGTLKPNERMPPQRQLAASLAIDLTTVTRAYAEAHRRGLLDGAVGRGTFVRADAAPQAAGPAERSLIDMSMNLPPLAPSLRDQLRTGLAGLLQTPDLQSLLAYRTAAGNLADRTAGAVWMQPVLGSVDPALIVVCAGAQCALTALMTLLARPGDTVLTDMLTYPVFRALAAQAGVRLAGVAADADGMLPDALEQACRLHQPKAIYCVPTMHNPTAVTMPPSRRQLLADVATQFGVPIIEDDAYGLLPTAPLPAVVSLAADAGYYVSTVAKCLTPGLRVAFVRAPNRTDAGRLAAAVRATSLTPSPLMVSLLSAWIRDGSAATLRDGVRAEASVRQTMIHTMLPQAAMTAHNEGLHVWLHLPEPWDRMDFVAHLRRLGLALVASDAFLVSGSAPNAVRVCLGVAESRTALRLALQDLATALADEAPALSGDVV